jgi:DNA-binding response OmpR family regulator
MKILVVDDDEDARASLEIILEEPEANDRFKQPDFCGQG